ncbi:hypothetical protein BT69DRAFT_1330636 [Atractiella rhizophila]|nr:hypothetical protein BT69DRAFT_1330636 [Atractiella rhizophila]
MGVVSSSIVSIISGVGAVIRSTLQLASDLTVGVFNIAIAFLEFSKKLLKGIFNGLIVLFGVMGFATTCAFCLTGAVVAMLIRYFHGSMRKDTVEETQKDLAVISA